MTTSTSASTSHSARPVPASVPARGPLVGVLVAVSLSFVSGACMLSVEAEVPDVEVTQHDIAFAGIPHSPILGNVATGMAFSQDRPKLDLPASLDSSVQAVRIELRAKTGIQNFDFLSAMRITMQPKNSDADPIELINYEKPEGVVVGSTLTVPSRNPVNILDQWKADSATFNLEVAGVLPENDWTMDMVMHFAGRVSYKY